MGMSDAFVQEIDQEGKTTRRVLERVPSDQLAWRPHAKSMSLGELALHTAQVPGTIASWALEDTMNLSGAPKQSQTAIEEARGHIHDSIVIQVGGKNGEQASLVFSRKRRHDRSPERARAGPEARDECAGKAGHERIDVAVAIEVPEGKVAGIHVHRVGDGGAEGASRESL